jgi:two-component system copper resistance phosphate regulon response regulator CusR
MLPDINGLEILKTIRSKSVDTSVIILTAEDQTKDKITGLDLGADD